MLKIMTVDYRQQTLRIINIDLYKLRYFKQNEKRLDPSTFNLIYAFYNKICLPFHPLNFVK